jgi:hypothetical protein
MLFELRIRYVFRCIKGFQIWKPITYRKGDAVAKTDVIFKELMVLLIPIICAVACLKLRQVKKEWLKIKRKN